jgi:hypothetical protein
MLSLFSIRFQVFHLPPLLDYLHIMRLIPLLVLFTATFAALAAPISEASCAKIYSLCIDAARGVGQRYWRWSPFGLPQLNECVLAATCYPANLDDFLATLEHEAWPLSTQAPLPAQSIPRLSQEVAFFY